MKKILYSIGIIVLVVATGLIIFNAVSSKTTNGKFIFDKITRGDLINTVSSTGTINAVSTVEVGTQVSGIIDKLYVDFNDQVKKGQLLAVLDTVLLKTALMDAQANLEKAKAMLEQAQADYNRNLPLFEKGLISEAEFLPIKIQLKTQKANLTSAQAAFERAQRNLKYAFIHSPINGTVIQRNVEEGQTVAASFQAPVLFIIAEDLSKMEIHAQVDESDIGMIKTGQRVTFTVQAYPDKTFHGTVRQIRLQPTTIQNVVNYTVVIDAANNENLLLPGMTATVDFIVEERKNVLLVPNAALRFQPSEQMMQAFFNEAKKRFESAPDSVKNKMPRMGGPNSRQARPKDAGTVWYLDENNKLVMAPFKAGITDGKLTEVVMSRDLKEGMQVIVGLTGGNEKKTTSSTQRNFGPPRPF
ncbi:MAG: efflux RND transporter periplasmic adaptor subunit [candidate division KSB1 bacterium]|nr:efflux RND transporter periplasmic adaptor subunit [candidate division KSB1 bacterium]MDZ7336475.1 efflux RND transporter periplasmic adaptor subunit [candidate division KSB1 bacterium]MDZ7357254.1 efflux RND transporter periplasmic adaptor subunit [candidate division KSB1 bacterium]MDZ7402118.1 efflux RND transporter periplasmic adaptor subunit [candidate division KSB1 bacterium]